jgi:hypothetical protein
MHLCPTFPSKLHYAASKFSRQHLLPLLECIIIIIGGAKLPIHFVSLGAVFQHSAQTLSKISPLSTHHLFPPQLPNAKLLKIKKIRAGPPPRLPRRLCRKILPQALATTLGAADGDFVPYCSPRSHLPQLNETCHHSPYAGCLSRECAELSGVNG